MSIISRPSTKEYRENFDKVFKAGFRPKWLDDPDALKIPCDNGFDGHPCESYECVKCKGTFTIPVPCQKCGEYLRHSDCSERYCKECQDDFCLPR